MDENPAPEKGSQKQKILNPNSEYDYWSLTRHDYRTCTRLEKQKIKNKNLFKYRGIKDTTSSILKLL